MKRCCLFLLMCLFSLQAFAGMRMSNDISPFPHKQLVAVDATSDAGTASAHDHLQKFSQDDDEEGGDQVSAGDETIPVSVLVYVSHALALAPPLCSDPAPQPPFLPPPARPPRA